MQMKLVHYFITQLITLLLFMAEIQTNILERGTGVSADDNTSIPHILRFLYENEQLCK